MQKIRVAVFTSSRADYGPLRPLLKLLREDSDFELLLLVAGSHLSQRFGFTKSEIESDHFNIDAEFDFLADPADCDFLTRSLSRLQLEIGLWLCKNRPDWLIVLGDRFELLAVASAALLTKLPLAHISGGDITEGAIDNQVRHAVSKIASVHFPATDAARQVLLSLGEEEWRIHLVGEPALDQIAEMKLLPKRELFSSLGLDSERQTAIMTFHPDTITNVITPDFVQTISRRLIASGLQMIATGSNFDAGGDEINRALAQIDDPGFTFEMSLGQQRYYSMLKYSSLLIGNSSSGIIEAKSFNIPVIDVGARQLGRLSNPNVLHVEADVEAICRALPRALSKEFVESFQNCPNVYGDGNASGRIVAYLKRIPKENLFQKR